MQRKLIIISAGLERDKHILHEAGIMPRLYPQSVTGLAERCKDKGIEFVSDLANDNAKELLIAIGEEGNPIPILFMGMLEVFSNLSFVPDFCPLYLVDYDLGLTPALYSRFAKIFTPICSTFGIGANADLIGMLGDNLLPSPAFPNTLNREHKVEDIEPKEKLSILYPLELVIETFYSLGIVNQIVKGSSNFDFYPFMIPYRRDKENKHIVEDMRAMAYQICSCEVADYGEVNPSDFDLMVQSAPFSVWQEAYAIQAFEMGCPTVYCDIHKRLKGTNIPVMTYCEMPELATKLNEIMNHGIPRSRLDDIKRYYLEFWNFVLAVIEMNSGDIWDVSETSYIKQ